MKENEIWKLLQNFIEIKEKKQEGSLLEHLISLNEQNERLRKQGLELYYKENRVQKKATFFIITPYLVQLFTGVVTEREGILHIESWEMLKQIPCDSIATPNMIGRVTECENPFEAIAPFVKEEAYILNGLNGEIHYYQEKDIDGLYGRTLETSFYLKIGFENNFFKENKKIVEVPYQADTSLEDITLVEQDGKIIPVLKQFQSESCLVTIDIANFIKEVEKVYQLL